MVLAFLVFTHLQFSGLVSSFFVFYFCRPPNNQLTCSSNVTIRADCHLFSLQVIESHTNLPKKFNNVHCQS